MHNAIIIPAREQSGRLPGKMLLPYRGKPLFLAAVETALAANDGKHVYVATDSHTIGREAARAGAIAIETGPAWCGTRRAREAWDWMVESEKQTAATITVLQGDTIGLDPANLNELAQAASDGPHSCWTLYVPLEEAEQHNPNVVKILLAAQPPEIEAAGGFARVRGFARTAPRADRWDTTAPLARHHVGVYTFGRAAWYDWSDVDETPAAREQSLEQLAWGATMFALPAAGNRPIGINTAEDYARLTGHEPTEQHA